VTGRKGDRNAKNHLERVLFVVGNRHRGKSTQLRSMFRDVRLGTGGSIPKDRKLADVHRLTNDRFLYLRPSSPPELKETTRGFPKKTENKIKAANSELGTRWNLASALQLDASNNMPDAVETCAAFVEHFNPQRTCVFFLNPDRKGDFLPEKDVLRSARGLRCFIACSLPTRGRLYASLFCWASSPLSGATFRRGEPCGSIPWSPYDTNSFCPAVRTHALLVQPRTRIRQ
jgi:hypothetical protein